MLTLTTAPEHATRRPQPRNHSRQVHGLSGRGATPAPVAAPQLIAHSPEVAAMLTGRCADAFSGDGGGAFRQRPAARDGAYATAYAGHQFGNWAGQLGDGKPSCWARRSRSPASTRAALRAATEGRGPTPLSPRRWPRGAAGRQSANFCVRKRCIISPCPPRGRCRWCSPAIRSSATCSTTANPELEPGAIVCRVAPSFPLRAL